MDDPVASSGLEDSSSDSEPQPKRVCTTASLPPADLRDKADSDSESESEGEAGGDDVDFDAAEAACGRRLRDRGLNVPQRPLAREEAWSLAHASEWQPIVDDEF